MKAPKLPGKHSTHTELATHRSLAVRLLGCVLVVAVFEHDVSASEEERPRRDRTYDVLHYRLELTLDEEQKSVAGTANITLMRLGERLDSVVLDAEQLTVQTISLSGKQLCFRNDSHELTAYLQQPAGQRDTVTLSIQYSCKPAKGLYFIQPDSTDPTRRHQIWTQGEDMDNRYWFPCYDLPDDKATSEIIATVPERYVVLSNGKLESTTHEERTRTRSFHWRQYKPHSSYLIMLVAGAYEVLQEPHTSVPMQYYVYREYAADAHCTFAKTPAMLRFFEQRIGIPYPWEKFAQVFVNQFPLGGMENTSVVTLNEIYMFDPRATIDFTADDVIAHELTHQWWGNLVTCRDWTHLWLNEGFATYFAWQFMLYDKGADAFQYERMQDARLVLQTEERLGRKPIVDKGSHTTDVYKKGAWVLSMLRDMVGEADFWKALHLYIQRYAFDNVDTREFQAVVEEVSGCQLGWFFDQWLYKAGHPDLSVKTDWIASRRSLTVTITEQQTQDSLTRLFTFPLDIECTTADGKTLRTFQISKQSEIIEIPLDDKPLMVIVDKGMKLLKTMTFEKSVEEYIYQLAHAADVSDRIVAAKELRRYKEDGDVFSALRRSATSDSFWAVRMEATISLGRMENEGLKDALFEIYRDNSSRVRQAAIVALEKFPSPDVARFIENAAQRDSSYLVVGSCVTVMQEVDSAKAFDLAREYVSMHSYRDIVRRAALAAFRALADVRAVPSAVQYTAPGNASDIRALSIGVLGAVGGKHEQARTAVRRLLQDADAAIRAAAVRALSAWGDKEAMALIEARKSVEEDGEVKKAIEDALDLD